MMQWIVVTLSALTVVSMQVSGNSRIYHHSQLDGSQQVLKSHNEIDTNSANGNEDIEDFAVHPNGPGILSGVMEVIVNIIGAMGRRENRQFLHE